MNKECLTRRGVCTNLAFSPYTFTNIHKDDVYTLHFSSKLHLDNFVKNRQKNYSMIYNDIYKRYKFGIDCTFLSDFNLYKKIETRGCYIRYNDNVFKCYDNIII